MSNSSMNGTALVSGASTGIGAVYADRLAKRGYDLILVARNEARLKSLSARLTSDTGRSVKVLRADLNKAWFKNGRFRVALGISARTLIGPARWSGFT